MQHPEMLLKGTSHRVSRSYKVKALSGACRADAELLAVFPEAAVRPCVPSLAESCSPALSGQALPQLP